MEHHSISPLVDLLDKTVEHVFHDALHALIRALRFGGIIGGKHMAGGDDKPCAQQMLPASNTTFPFAGTPIFTLSSFLHDNF